MWAFFLDAIILWCNLLCGHQCSKETVSIVYGLFIFSPDNDYVGIWIFIQVFANPN